MKLFKKCLSYILLGGVAAGLLFIFPHYVSADETQNSALHIQETALSETRRVPCPFSDVVIKNRMTNGGVTDRIVSACPVYNDDIDLIFYHFDDGGSYIAVRAKGSSSAYIPIKDFSTMDQLRYSNGTLTFRNWRTTNIIAVDDFPKSYEPKFYDSEGEVVEYAYKSDAIHSVLGNVNSYAISSNGRYILTNNNGFYDTFDRITNDTFGPIRITGDDFFGGSVNTDAISDDGRYLFVGSESLLIDLGDCSSDFQSELTDRGSQVYGRCKITNLNRQVKSLAGYAPYSIDPRFIYRGNNVIGIEFETVEFTSFTQGANGNEAPRRHFKVWFSDERLADDNKHLEYLALGDSYSSGEGDQLRNKMGQKYYRTHTDDDGTVTVDGFTNQVSPKEKCHLSTNSYPYHLAQGMEFGDPTTSIDTTRWQSVACSGATVWDVKEQGSGDYKGQGDGDKPRLEGYDAESLKDQALNEFIPGRQKQIEFVKKYQPKVITLTMGGNDVDFGGKMNICVQDISTCVYATRDWRSKLRNELAGQYKNLNSLYKELIEATNGKTKIYVLGYPNYINADPRAECSKILHLDIEERVMIANSIVYLNNIIEAAAKNAGVAYVDIEHAFGNHRICDTGDKHVNAITGVFGYHSNEEQESFHPNDMGHVDMANAVWDFSNGQSLIDYKTCGEDKVSICPDAAYSAASAVIPPYFDIDMDDDTVVRYYTLTNGTMVKSIARYNASLRFGWFEPDSKVDITLYSTPTRLGQFTVDTLGNLDASIVIPSNITAGYHRLVAKGTSADGLPIEVYQTVLINGSDNSDLDDDGVLDSEDKCAYGLPIDESVDIESDLGCNTLKSKSMNIDPFIQHKSTNTGILTSKAKDRSVMSPSTMFESVQGKSDKTAFVQDMGTEEKRLNASGFTSLIYVVVGLAFIVACFLGIQFIKHRIM